MTRIEPGMPDAVVLNDDKLYAWGDGTLRRGSNILLPKETIEQYRQGYRCIRCHGVQDEPFPRECQQPFCRFPMRDRQLDLLAVEDGGEMDPWPNRRTDMWLPGDEW
jgi:hypothetical protein